MRSIEIDDQVMEHLTSHATPFVDTPNSVLRRLLGLDRGQSNTSKGTPEPEHQAPRRNPSVRPHSSEKGDRHEFIDRILSTEFEGSFRVRSPYQMMYESTDHLVYFQNFNATGSHNLWFRLNSRPLGILRNTNKSAFICLTNPAEGFAFLLSIEDVLGHAAKANWTRSEFEVNIDPATRKWREFDWDLTSFRKSY